MLKATLRLVTLSARNTLILPNLTSLSIPLHRTLFSFCQSQKHQRPDKQYHPEKKHRKDNSDETHHNPKEEEKSKHQHQHKQNNHKQAHHQHGPGCKHDHGHQHESHNHASNHQHGPGCSHDHHAAHPNVKLSKLSFEELIKLETEESLKYAHLIYEQEIKKLRQIEEQRQHVLKNLEFYRKIEQDIKEKESKIQENIKIYEEELKLSTKRAEKQVDQSKTFAVTKIAKELLEVADCIANCKKFAEQSELKDKYIELIIQSQQVVRDILKKYQIEQFDPTNQEYDPNYQQSLLQIPTPAGCKEGHVAMTMRTGYKIKGRLLRSARVGVFS